MSQKLMQNLPGKILSFLAVALLTTLVIVGIRSATANDTTAAVRTAGWAENLVMTGVEQSVPAKLDTGATTTSINAEVLEKPDDDVESGGFVTFNFVDTDGNKTLYERPLSRWVEIKGDGRRPVVEMSFCLDGEFIEGEVSLAERDEFDYAVLFGRNLLKQARFAVDSAQTFVTGEADPQACREVSNQ
ncbi:MAG: RimK/LysX family protein [Cyanobacteria bacterium J06627_28]